MPSNYIPGDQPVPGFRLVEFLGRGGFGEVWKATAPGGAQVALKVIDVSRRGALMELRSLRMFTRIRHANLVPLSGFWFKDEDGMLLETGLMDLNVTRVFADNPRATMAPAARPAELIVAMGLGDKNLLDRLHECQQAGLSGVPTEELLGYMEGAAAAIDFLNSPRHDLGAAPAAVQHCDVKPQNLLLVGSAVQLCDFGLARVLGDARQAIAAYSVAYAAPELLRDGAASQATDQYSLAITWHELRTGELPFADASSHTAVSRAHCTGELDWSRLPATERSVLERAAAMAPADRFPSALAMVEALRQAVPASRRAGRISSVTDVRPESADLANRELAPRPRKRVLAGVVAAVAAAGLAAGIILALPIDASPSRRVEKAVAKTASTRIATDWPPTWNESTALNALKLQKADSPVVAVLAGAARATGETSVSVSENIETPNHPLPQLALMRRAGAGWQRVVDWSASTKTAATVTAESCLRSAAVLAAEAMQSAATPVIDRAESAAELLAREDWAGASGDFTLALEQTGDDARSYLGRGQAAAQLGRFASALADFAAAERLASDPRMAYQARLIVEVVADRLPLDDGQTLTGQVAQEDELIVREVQGDRLLVELNQSDRLPGKRIVKRGWIDASGVRAVAAKR